MAALALRSLDHKLFAFRRSAAIVGIDLPSIRTTTTTHHRRIRPFSHFTNLQSERVRRGENNAADFEQSPMLSPTRREPPTEDASLPWYLKVRHPRRTFTEVHPFAERQRLPSLPPNPPPSLQRILEHISIDLGLDDLCLLDLRPVDPPPALGANLLMIIGTARSEKHLHVSADRFCRWLRSTYKLRPYADGLLGRNELKLKMRRKNRRTRLLANVGATTKDDNVDDGIRTGWICVRVGRVEAGAGAEGTRKVSQDFVGFGDDDGYVTIVVQMFTEEKKADIDLEGLWVGVLERVKRKREYIEAGGNGGIDEISEEQSIVSDIGTQLNASRHQGTADT